MIDEESTEEEFWGEQKRMRRQKTENDRESERNLDKWKENFGKVKGRQSSFQTWVGLGCNDDSILSSM